MTTQTLIKQPSESRLYKLWFTGLLAAGETISSVTSLVVTLVDDGDVEVTTDLTITEVSYEDSYVQFRASAGDAAIVYTITAIVATSAANTVEGEVRIHVKAL